MGQLRILSSAEQVAAHLRERLLRGDWSGTMPGVNRLAKELGVNHKAVDNALQQLERERLLKGQGTGCKRLIVKPRSGAVQSSPLRVAILLHDRDYDLTIEYICALFHTLPEAEHHAFYAKKSLTQLKLDVKRVERLVEQTDADAWVVYAGSREILEWFSARPEPSFAIHGDHGGILMAGLAYDKIPAVASATRQLIDLGHRRIVMLLRKQNRLPEQGPTARAFLAELETHGIPTGAYNLPDWEASRSGLHEILNALFQVTAPTALLIDEPLIFSAARQFLINRGIRVPEEVSLICLDSNPNFSWCVPSIAHIQTDTLPISRDIMRWLKAVSKGQKSVRQKLYPAKFSPGGTIGPAPKG